MKDAGAAAGHVGCHFVDVVGGFFDDFAVDFFEDVVDLAEFFKLFV